MLKKLLFALALCIVPYISAAQQIDSDDIARYSARGAVPTTSSGAVEWRQTTACPGVTADVIYDRLSAWLYDRITRSATGSRSRITRRNADTGDLSAWLQETLVFRRSALVSDEALMTYHLALHVVDGSYDVVISRISYRYDAMQTDNLAESPDMPAEEWITDPNAITRSGKLHRIGGRKFRIHTLAHIEKLLATLSSQANGH